MSADNDLDNGDIRNNYLKTSELFMHEQIIETWNTSETKSKPEFNASDQMVQPSH